jgi:hypothetical protein
MYTIFKYSVPLSQETQCFSIRNKNILILYREIIDVHLMITRDEQINNLDDVRRSRLCRAVNFRGDRDVDLWLLV